MYADKFHSKTEPPTFIEAATYAASAARFGEDKTKTFKQLQDTFGAPDLTRLIAAHGHALA